MQFGPTLHHGSPALRTYGSASSIRTKRRRLTTAETYPKQLEFLKGSHLLLFRAEKKSISKVSSERTQMHLSSQRPACETSGSLALADFNAPTCRTTAAPSNSNVITGVRLRCYRAAFRDQVRRQQGVQGQENHPEMAGRRAGRRTHS